MNALINYTLHLADNTLILAQRHGEWCGHGPVLEQDIALTNMALDLLGQSRNFYQYAAQLINANAVEGSKAPSPGGEGVGGEVTEDSLAYLRKEHEFKNCLLVEQPNGDWAQTVLRQLFFSAYQYLLYKKMQEGSDAQLAAIAAKALKEVTYHRRWSSEWVIRLGDGTDESHARMLKAIEALWPYTGELFMTADYEAACGYDMLQFQEAWMQNISEVFAEATLPLPQNVYMQKGGKQGVHTEHMGYILTELQYVQRAYPGCEW